MKRFVLILALIAPSLVALGADSASTPAPVPIPAPDIASFHPQDDVWLGCKRHRFQLDGCDCWIVEPKSPLAGNHWDWWMMFPGVYPDRTGANALLAKGYYFAYISVGDTFGAPSALAHLSAFYQAMVKAGFRSKAALVGISRGGLYAFNWAAQNPDKVSVIYGDAPVCNFASWPYAHGDPKGAVEWKKLLDVYGYKTTEEGLACPTQPIKEMRPIVAAGIPVICVVGDVDTTVPYLENAALIKRQYVVLSRTLGIGAITILHKPLGNHHPHGLDDPTPVVDFILQYDK